MSLPTQRDRMLEQGLIRRHPFELWVEAGAFGEKGLVDIIVRLKADFGYIQPVKFPEHRLYFRMTDLPNWAQKEITKGMWIEFDIPPQPFQQNRTPVVNSLRLLMSKGSKQ